MTGSAYLRIEVAFDGTGQKWPHFVATVADSDSTEVLYELGPTGWRRTLNAGGDKGFELVDQEVDDSELEDLLWEGAAVLTESPEAEAFVRLSTGDWCPWERTNDPRGAGGRMVDVADDPHARGSVVFDSRNAVLVERIETAVAHTTQRGKPGPDAVALTIEGRINRPPDLAASAEAPAEHVTHLHMMSWEGAADLVVDLHSLAARDGFDLNDMVKEKWAAAEAKGLTERAPR